MKKFLLLTWVQSGTLVTLIILAILLAASFALTSLLVAGICWAFGWVFSSVFGLFFGYFSQFLVKVATQNNLSPCLLQYSCCYRCANRIG